jgi:hypothetical protein
MNDITRGSSEQNTVIKSFHASKFSIQRSDLPNRIELQASSTHNYQLKKRGEDISPLKMMMMKTSNLQFQIGNISPKNNNSLKASQRIFFKDSNNIGINCSLE